MRSGPGGDGAEGEANTGLGLGLDVSIVGQALADQNGVDEGHQRPHQKLRRLGRIDLFELAGGDAVADDELDDAADDPLMRLDRIPAVLDRNQDDVINALVRKQIYLVIGEDLENQALEACRSRTARPGNFPRSRVKLGEAPPADRFDRSEEHTSELQSL